VLVVRDRRRARSEVHPSEAHRLAYVERTRRASSVKSRPKPRPPAIMGVGSGGQGDRAPWIFKHGTNIVDRDLKVLFFGHFLLFFGLFSVGLPWKMLNSAIFRYFLQIFGLFFCCLPPLENFLPTPLLQ